MSARATILAAYAGMCLIWGTTWLAIKVGLQYLPPVSGVGLRFVIAGLFLYGIAAIRGETLPVSKLPWKLICVLALTLFGLNYVLTYTAEVRLSSGLVAVLFGTLPFFTFAFGHHLVGERTTLRTWIGAVLAFGGVAVISLAGDLHGSLLFGLAAIGAASISGFANVYAKRHSESDPLIVLPPSMLLAGMVLAAIGFGFEHPILQQALRLRSIFAVLYLAIFGSSIAFFLNLWLLQRVAVGTVGLSALIIPVLAVVVGIVFGHESFGLRELIGAALVIVGVWIALARASLSEGSAA